MAFYTLSHGPPPPAEATHTWAPSTADAPPVMGTNSVEPRELPEIEVLRCTGWYDGGDIVDNREGATSGIGDVAYPPRMHGLTRVYEAVIRTHSRFELLAAIAGLTGGYVIGDDATMTVLAWPAWGGPTPVTWVYTARVIALTFDPAPVQLDDGATIEWAFVLTLRLADPRWYGTAP